MAVLERADNPGVRIPPPLIYAAAAVGGWLLNREWNWPIGGGTIRVALGWALFVASLSLVLTALGSFRRYRTTMLPFRPASALVDSGLYRYTRNPMYLGGGAAVLAIGLWLNTWWPFVLLIPALSVIQRYVIRREENYMRRRFGAEYDAYTRTVRRWL
jgi:protein-S-isoprenylcysteine O-methyltransferase Ste14